MNYLLDTCVLSEAQRPEPNQNVITFISQLHPDHTFISALTIGELEKGIQLLEQGKRKKNLEAWLQVIVNDYGDKIFPVTTDTACIWGKLLAKAKRKGIGLPVIDALIAATAIQHGAHLVTRNVADFSETGVLIINPWHLT